MHIPDGLFVNGVAINAATAAVSAVACGVALRRANRMLGPRQVPLLGVMAALVFAAQMLNLPIAGGTSGHFLGAVLAAVLLGPWNALLVMTVVLLIQCLLFADGGLTALGANVLNMGLIGGVCGYGVFAAVQMVLPRSRWSFLAATAAASWASVVLASAACAVELALSNTIRLKVGLPAMVGVHALIGTGEAIITTAALSLIVAARPDLVAGRAAFLRPLKGSPGVARGVWTFCLVVLGLALLVVVFSPLASSKPDGLERVVEDHGPPQAARHSGQGAAPMPDYKVPGVSNDSAAKALAGLAGTLAVFVGLGCLVVLRRKPRPTEGNPGATPPSR